MRGWPIAALFLAVAFLLSLGIVAAGPSFVGFCDVRDPYAPDGTPLTVCARLVDGAESAAIASGIALLAAMLVGAVEAWGRRARRHEEDARPLVSVHARKR